MNRYRRIAGLALGFAVAAAPGCSTYNLNYPRPESHAFQGQASTRLGRAFVADAAAHPGLTGVTYISEGREALEARLAMADLAEKSLDLQYYIWDADISGRLLGERLVRAAERGVHVRLLLDDHSIVDRDLGLAQLSGHPNIEIRAFNPYRDRSRIGDLFTDLSRVNRRSHNKLLITDNAVALVGGRNIADHYFGVHGEANYRDLDVLAIGPAVADISEVFDRFWNSKFSVPYGAFVDKVPSREETDAVIARLRANLASDPAPYPITEDLASIDPELNRLRSRLSWANARFIFDDPSKAEDKTLHPIVDELVALSSKARKEIVIENAYFVPRPAMVERLGALTARGVRVRVLTNSLASNDVVPVYSGYKKYRDDLLRKGVEIYELRPDSSIKKSWSLRSSMSRSGLHTKTLVIDRRYVVIGSCNLDPRSADINSETSLVVDSPEFAEEVGAYLDEGVRADQSYRVSLDSRGRVQWTTEIDGRDVTYHTDPQTSRWRRLQVGLIGLLPIHSQL